MRRLLSVLAVLGIPFPVLAQGFTPDEAVKRMKLPPGFSVRCVVHEPMIRQPLSMSFDNRGRMWVLQYLQYPNPAGLKAVKQDQYLRTIWDKVPEAPPKGPKGLDKITICSDPDENGVFRKSKDFVTGLNLACAFCIGNGGVYVAQPPYLLFYPDKNEDDVPDGDPEVVLTGFGMDDTHSLANSMQWGPDGWLYGATGSTSTSKIKNSAKPDAPIVEFQQGIWRYHPQRKEFELFSEGGGNTYGLDFDRHGNAIAGTNYGGFAMLHQFPGAYYVKGFSKHGPLHNPHTYGYFEHVPYKNFKGGHVTCGGVLYQADAYPKEYHDQYIGGNLLSNAIYWHKMRPKGASFEAEHGGDLLEANDTWFRPVDLMLGPDGCIYIADWYDKRAAHLDPIDSWDKTNGRIYRVEYQGGGKYPNFDLRKKSAKELVELLKHSNKWWRNEARRLLIERKEKEVVPQLRELTRDDNTAALEALWTLYGLKEFRVGFTKDSEDHLLTHSNEYMRAWVARLLGDPKEITQFNHAELISLAKRESHPVVLAQLACTAKRLEEGCNLATHVARRPGIEKDPHIPLLCWWAIEREAISIPSSTLKSVVHFRTDKTVIQDFLLERLARRYMADGSKTGYQFAGELLRQSWYYPERTAILKGLELGLEGQRFEAVPPSFLEGLKEKEIDWTKLPEADRLRLFAKLGDESSRASILKVSLDSSTSEAQRLAGITLLSQLGYAKLKPLLPEMLKKARTEAERESVLAAIQRLPDDDVSGLILGLYAEWSPKLKKLAVQALLSRPVWAMQLVKQHEAGKFPKPDFTLDHAKAAVALNDPDLTKIVEKTWGKIGPATPGEKQARISWLNITISRGTGDRTKGKELYAKHCAVCHQLFGEGTKIGPDLTTSDRKNRGYMLTHIIDPSLYIRPEFIQYNVRTTDGRRLSGVVSTSTNDVVTLINVVENKEVKSTLSKSDIEDMKPSSLSLMPEKILDTFSDQDARDFFAYLQSDPPAKKEPAKENPAKKDTGKKLKVLLISGSLEYKSDESLAEYQKYLEANFNVECTRAFRKKDDDIPGLDALDTCDVAVFYTRRLTITGEQLDRVKKYASSGKPIVAIRTASHGFQNWLAMDADVLGGSYKGHYGANLKCDTKLTDKGKDHPIMKGVKDFTSNGSLYKNAMNAADVTVLMNGSIPDHTEPITWVRELKGGRIFYTSLGHPDDFKNENFIKMLTNAIFWTTKRE